LIKHNPANTNLAIIHGLSDTSRFVHRLMKINNSIFKNKGFQQIITLN